MDAVGAVLLLENGFAHCRVVVDQQGGLFVSLFLAGLVSSIGHCAAMCGPFVLSQVGARLEKLPVSQMSERHRLCSALLVSYHLGRTSTYMLLGALAGMFAEKFGALVGVRWLSAALLGLAAAGFFVSAGVRLGAWLPSLGLTSVNVVGAVLGRLVQPLWGGAGPVGWHGYALGMALGFLPCGLLYSALAAAASARNPLAASIGLLAFSAGTIPALIAVGLAGHVAGRRWRTMLNTITPIIMIGNAAFLLFLAWNMAIS